VRLSIFPTHVYAARLVAEPWPGKEKQVLELSQALRTLCRDDGTVTSGRHPLLLVRAELATTTLILTAMLPVALAGQVRAGGGAARDPPRVAGSVVDRETVEPLEAVVVTLRPLDGGVDRPGVSPSTLTGAAGRFFFEGLEGGRYRIEIERLGYRAVTDSISYSPDLGLRIEVRLVQEAVELEPLLVVAEARSRALERNGFYDRRRRGIGRFVTRDEIRTSNALEVSHLFRMMPGVSVRTPAGIGGQSVLLMRGGCVADVYVDGIRTIPPYPVDMMLRTTDLDGVEVYHGSEMPGRLSTTSCGAVMFWTYVPNPGDVGNPFTWRRTLVAAGFVALAFLLIR
jgi:hypothetical protein